MIRPSEHASDGSILGEVLAAAFTAVFVPV